MAVSCIYAIENRLNGKRYIGSASHNVKRWHRHRKMLKTESHPSKHLQASWNKYGHEVFDFKVLEVVEDRLFLAAREQFWIWHTKCDDPKFGYNTHSVANSSLGRKDSEETRRKKSEAGKKRWANGYKHPPEAIEKMREANWGNKNMVGRTHTPETREKLRQINLGNKNSAGRTIPEHLKKQTSERMRRLNSDPEWKKTQSQRIRDALKDKRKTHCSRGHEYNEENTYYNPSGGRACRKCHRIWSKEHRQRKKGVQPCQ